MRISSGFDTRARKLQDVWCEVCTSFEEPTSSLEEFENALASTQILLQEKPPAFQSASLKTEAALDIIQRESFLILDRKNLERLRKCSSNLRRLHSRVNDLTTEILGQHTPTSFAVRLSGRLYRVDATEMKDRLRNAAHILASDKVASHVEGTRTTGMLQKVSARAQQVRQRYLARKTALLKEYLETGAHQAQLEEAAKHVIAELRFRQMEKDDIRRLVTRFGSGSSRRQIDAFVRALRGDHQYSVYTMTPALSMESAKAVFPNLQLLQRGGFLHRQGTAVGLPAMLLQYFRALAQDTVIAESSIRASNPAEAVAQALIFLDVVAGCVAYIERPRRDSLLHPPPSLVYEGQRLVRSSGIGATRDDSLILRPSMNRKLRHLLKTIGAMQPQSSRTELQERVLTSMHWYMLGTTSRTLEERYVDHAIALEVLLSGKRTERDKKRMIAERATRLRRVLKVGKPEHKELIRRLYTTRNNLVHAGLHRARSLLQDSRDLEGAVLNCIFAAVDGVKSGCHTLSQLLDQVEKERVAARARRIRNSQLPPNGSAAFRGSLLLSSGKKIADLWGKLKLIDEGIEGYAYHELHVSRAKYIKPLRITNADQYWIRGKSATHQVELRDGQLVSGGHLFFVIGNGTKRFTYRAFDDVVFS